MTTNDHLGGIIWVTGYSGAGKTTVSRSVVQLFKEIGVDPIFLDGDDLRLVFGSNWGYDRDSRIELARVYFRLCNHLASQGKVVVIAAVAMFSEVAVWVREFVAKSLIVKLDAPEKVRLSRDSKTKQIYKNSDTSFYDLYDETFSPDMSFDNIDKADVAAIAKQVFKSFRKIDNANLDFGRKQHWSNYYSSAEAPSFPSPFAKSVSANTQPSRILEIGCGNGRDASFFARTGYDVTAIDISEQAIKDCIARHQDANIRFLSGKISNLEEEIGIDFDIVYCRFVIHAMPISEEVEVLSAVFSKLKNGGDFFIECRSVNDPLMRKGDVISPTERVSGHYRRFIVLNELKKRLEDIGFSVISKIESNGLAVFGDEDPVVIRIQARKN